MSLGGSAHPGSSEGGRGSPRREAGSSRALDSSTGKSRKVAEREEHIGFLLWKDSLLALGSSGLTREKPLDEPGAVTD